LLVGNRAALGQPARTGEAWAMRLLPPLGRLIPRSVRPIAADAVAAALVAGVHEAKPGVRIIESGDMQSYDRR
jgi:hypothetical protein